MKVNWTEAYQIVGEIVDYLSQQGIDSGILCQHYESLTDVIFHKNEQIFSTFQWKWIVPLTQEAAEQPAAPDKANQHPTIGEFYDSCTDEQLSWIK